MTSAPVSQYSPADPIPELGTGTLHPALNTPFMHDLIRPEHPLWTPRELRDLAKLITTELTSAVLKIVEVDPVSRWWARLALTAGVELWLLSWAPGQGTKPHDHGGASGAFSVLFGELTEKYRYPSGPVRHARRGVGASVGFSQGRAHQVTNSGTVNAASVHVYSPPLRPVNHYASLSDVPPPRRPSDYSSSGTVDGAR